jgi:hypothetical protein
MQEPSTTPSWHKWTTDCAEPTHRWGDVRLDANDHRMPMALAVIAALPALSCWPHR